MLRSVLCTPSVSCMWDWREALPEPGTRAWHLSACPPPSKEAESEGGQAAMGDEWGVRAAWGGKEAGEHGTAVGCDNHRQVF